MMLRERNAFSKLALPLSVLIFIAFALFVERSGITYSISHKPANFLDPVPPDSSMDTSETQTEYPQILFLYDSQGPVQAQIKSNLDAVFP